MITDSHDGASAPHGSLPGFRLGLRLALPVVPGMIAFGLAVGATAARKGFSFLDDLLMNLLVYAGMSQLVAMEVWPERIDLAALAGLALLCAIVNSRFLLMSAALHPWLGTLPPWKIYPALHILVDPGWLIATRYRAEGGSDTGVFFGSAVLLCVAWMSAIVVGHLLGGLVAHPRSFGIDLVMPIFFVAMLVPLWRGARRGIAWALAGVVALLVQSLLGGWWFIMAGAVAGSLAGGFLDDAE